jgi:hypothetical protein
VTLALAGAAQAAIVVDDFNDPSGGVSATISSPPGATTVSLGPTTGSLLGTRNITYSVTPSGPTSDAISVNTAPYGSFLVEASDNAASPDVKLNYSGFNVSLTGNTLMLHDYNTDANAESV